MTQSEEEIPEGAEDQQGVAEVSPTMFERLFETAPDAVLVVDSGGVIRRVNQQAEILFGYQRQELTGRVIETLMPERFRHRHQQLRQGYFNDPGVRSMGSGVELYARHRDGREIPLDIMLTPITAGKQRWVFAVVRDITRQKDNEARITALNSSLKNQIEQLTTTNRELESFSYSISHDLRAPLRHIMGFVDLLKTCDNGSLNQQCLHYLQVISKSAKKMADMVDGLLAFSRMGRSELHRTRIDLNRMVRDIVAEQVGRIKGREIDWEIALIPVVLADPCLLQQVLAHLLANAVKFTRPRPVARIEIGALEKDKQTIIFVRDNGVGFDIRYAHKIFGLFQRLHSEEEFEGNGIGLAHVQRIIQRHGGRVWVEGGVDSGTTVWFSLPNAPPGGDVTEPRDQLPTG